MRLYLFWLRPSGSVVADVTADGCTVRFFNCDKTSWRFSENPDALVNGHKMFPPLYSLSGDWTMYMRASWRLAGALYDIL